MGGIPVSARAIPVARTITSKKMIGLMVMLSSRCRARDQALIAARVPGAVIYTQYPFMGYIGVVSACEPDVLPLMIEVS
jgi:hypothetical protein